MHASSCSSLKLSIAQEVQRSVSWNDTIIARDATWGIDFYTFVRFLFADFLYSKLFFSCCEFYTDRYGEISLE